MISSRIIAGLIIIVCVMMPISGMAQSAADQFTISTSVITNDVTPPSIPVNLVATAVATTQIDLSWDPSTDDVGVDGYQVFRDGLQIATTTLTSYSDIGLTQSTLYAYTVTAFDAVPNISGHSATSSATTLSPITVLPSPGGNAYVPNEIRLLSFRVVAEEHAVTIWWETSERSRSVLQWGETTSYEIGSLSERAYTTWHQTRITGLDPGTRYELLIRAIGTFGNESFFNESFITKTLPDTEAPPNVRGFRAVKAGEDVSLTWENPSVDDFSHVRIVKGKSFYPSDPFDGALIYEGDDESALDRDAGSRTGPHYYALFAYDERGNVSSGAVAFLFIPGAGAVEVPPEEPSDTTILLRFGDVTFRQHGEEISFIGDRVTVDGAAPLTIEIAYEKLPENLKTILVSLQDPTDAERSFTFMLRVNEGKTAYTATIGALERSGTYPFLLSVFDYKNRTITKVEGSVVVGGDQEARTEREGFLAYLGRLLVEMDYWLFLLILLLLIIAYFLISREQVEHNDEKHLA